MPVGRRKLPGVLLLTLSALGILFSALLAGGLFIWLLSADRPAALIEEEISSAAVSASALLAALLNIPALVLSIRYLSGKPIPNAKPEPRKFSAYLITALLAVLLAGSAAAQREHLRWLLIPLSLPAVFLPIGWMVSRARRGLARPSLLEEWGTLTVGLTVVPVLILMLEFILLMIAIAAVVILLGFNPALLERLTSLPAILGNMQDGVEGLENAFLAFSQEPVIIGAMYVILGVAVPFVEELLKPLAVWLLAPKKIAPAEGYSLGLISGGAFALLESGALVSQMSNEVWLSVVALRGIASLLHIGLSGWVGYGIASAFNQKRPRPLLASLLGAIVLHGVWNSITLASGLSAIPLAGEPGLDLAPRSAGLVLFVMGAVLMAIVVINFRINRSLRSQAKEPAEPPENERSNQKAANGVNGKNV